MITKTDLVAKVSQNEEITKKDAEKHVEGVLTALAECFIAGDDVRIAGFGTFKAKTSAARIGRNPSTGASVEIAASKDVKFKIASDLKAKL